MPFSSEDSSDAIALRAAISSLQLQKKKAQDDMRVLENVKRQAVAQPEAFVRHVLDGGGGRSAQPARFDVRQTPTRDDEESSDDMATDGRRIATDKTQVPEIPDSQSTSFASSAQSQPASSIQRSFTTFPELPQPQDVVRCPPINWSKYHILGVPLQRLHNQQQASPNDGAGGLSRTRNGDIVIAAPYDAFTDQLDTNNSGTHAAYAGGISRDFAQARKDSGAEPSLQTRRGSKITNA